MKMVKSLLLGSAAGLVAVAGAQAADLPVKAKPVQYVKICSLYGVGFYYIPGTDMCIKIGGWVRAEYGYGQNGNFAWGFANGNLQNRNTNNSDFRARGYITADARDQTEYGTVRGYIAIGLSENEHGGDVNASTAFSANRAFIQWAGFTFGRAQSFFDFYSVPATSYWGAFPASDTGDGGWFVMGYTAQFGNGFSATIAAEAPRRTQVINMFTAAGGGAFFAAPGGGTTPLAFVGSTFAGFAGTNAAGSYGGFQVPDVVANLRVDQAWGSAQIMGALHEVNAQYYQNLGAIESQRFGAPDNKLGWAVGGGFKWNTPWLLSFIGGQGDYFQTQVTYAQGALRYIFQTPNSNWGVSDGFSGVQGILADAVYSGTFPLNVPGVLNNTPTNLNLTSAWNVNAAYEHFWWNPRWRTSIYGGYAKVEYGGQASNQLCGFGAGVIGLPVPGALGFGCDPNWNTWWVGSRTQWNVTKDFYMGLDVLYQKVEGGTLGTQFLSTSTGLTGALATNTVQGPGGAIVPQTDWNNWSFRFRVHRDFYP